MSYQAIYRLSIYYYRFAITLCRLMFAWPWAHPIAACNPTALRALPDWDSEVDEMIALYENPDAFTND